MTARWFSFLALAAALLSGGCCCYPYGNSCGGCFGLPRPITWYGACNECGPCPGESCAGPGSCCGPCGLLPGLRYGLSCGKGCGEIYCDEWCSDPPDCCDPCDQCYGQFTGPRGPCCLGPAQRILAALHGYRYCPRPYCGPWCPLFNGCRAPCGPACGPACGCGGDFPHGADIYYDGAPAGQPSAAPVQRPPQPQPEGAMEPTNILDENWEAPRVRPEPGRPIHNARQPSHGPLGSRSPRPTGNYSGPRQPPRNAPMASRPAAGSGVRQASYPR